MNNLKKYIIYIGILILGLFFGWIIFSNSSHDHTEQSSFEKLNEVWTCSMHPQIRKPESGNCPICGMELIPLSNENDNSHPTAINMSPTAMQLANVQTAIVSSQTAKKTISLNGKVQVDERFISTQTAHIPGRIEQLLVNYNGEKVRRGQTLAYVYSPDLINAQKELFEAYKIKDAQPAIYEAAKGKLNNWKISDSQIEEIISNGKIKENFPILSNTSGTIISKKIELGDYILKGAPLFEIANLNKLWILFDLYERDLEFVKVGNKVTYTLQSNPSKEFTGKISFIDPIIDPITRVAKARIEVKNISNSLKPEMFAMGNIESTIGHNENTIVVPKTAVMWTGKRSIVYVKNNSKTGVSFSLREVALGTSLGDSYLVVSGIEDGEEIVIHGTFSIDAAAQLAGKPSMMRPEGGNEMTGHNHGAEKENIDVAIQTKTLNADAKKAVKVILFSYFKLKDFLVKDDFINVKQEIVIFDNSIQNTNMSLFKGESHMLWMKYSNSLKIITKSMRESKDIVDYRNHFVELSKTIIEVSKSFKPIKDTLYVQRCPMANHDKGADWLSKSNEILNPYSSCNKVVRLKTDSSNNIITSFSKDSYSREEVISLLKLYQEDFCNFELKNLNNTFIYCRGLKYFRLEQE